ncbi:hypothetical protein Tco_0877964 [Tanacetum coccineum]|uniref:Integrase, catalytic region, zinc finger, CCHC-type, peptidase aspartic, catalytic n=1 Tax=Tanacetum coccineum TaxID=301880 RepID=A0ABQ5BZT1_9ASTR
MSLSLAKNVIVAGADSRPLMLDKTNYRSWASRMLLYIKGKECFKLLVDSVLNGPFQYETIVEPGNETTPETNIVLQGLPQDIYNLVNHNEDAKQIWDRVKLLIQGSELSLQERESKLYDDFDTFTSMPGEPIHSYYMRFAQLINDIHTIGMTMKPLQVNTKFVKHLQPEWSKFVTDVKLAKDMHTTNLITLSAKSYYSLSSGSSTTILSTRFEKSYQAPAIHQPMQPSFPELDSGLVVLSFNPFDDLIASLNKAMAFLSITFASRFPQINNQLRTSSNPRNQTTIQDGRVTVQTVQGRQTQGYAKSVKNQKGPRITWFKEKMLLTEALESGAYLDLKQLAFLADNEDTVIPAQAYQEIISLAAFQADDLDAFDSDCDDVPSAKAVLMANLSSYDSDVLSDVPFHDINLENDISYQSVQEKQCSEQPSFDIDIEIDITSDSNIISYEHYLQETKKLVIQNTSSSAQQDEVLTAVIEEMYTQVAKYNKEVHALYDGHTIVKIHVALSVTDTDETLELAEDKLKDMKAIFNQMETKGSKCSVDTKYFEIEKKELSLDNDRLLEHIICQDVMNTVMHANDHSDNVLHTNNNSFEHDNSALDMLKHENDRLMELLIS